MKIEIIGLSKVYPGGKHALSNINLTIENGMFGLLGPNGAGKSSLMRILVTLLYEMQARNARKGIAGLCLGGGNAVALAVERA